MQFQFPSKQPKGEPSSSELRFPAHTLVLLDRVSLRPAGPLLVSPQPPAPGSLPLAGTGWAGRSRCPTLGCGPALPPGLASSSSRGRGMLCHPGPCSPPGAV